MSEIRKKAIHIYVGQNRLQKLYDIKDGIKTIEQFNDQWVESERKRVSYAKQVWQDDYKNFRKAIDEKIA